MTIPDIASLSLIDFAKIISANFWSRIKFARAIKPIGRLRVSEASLTEELVYQFYVMAASKVLPVKIFQSTHEKVNGSDLEILLEIDGSVVKLPCQAKVIYATGRYGALYHEVRGQLQIDLLIQHANRIGGYPIYMFYNYDGYMPFELLKITAMEERLWGCSVGSANEIKNKFFDGRTIPPMFHEMHPAICWPFYKLFEFLDTKEAGKGIGSIFDGFTLDGLKKYRIEEILDDPGFSDLTSPETLGFVDHFEKAPSLLVNEKTLQQEPEFNPRFRLLFTKENLNIRKIQLLN